MRHLLLATLAITLNDTSLRAHAKEMVDLFPPETVFYAEIIDPTATAGHLAALTKQTIFSVETGKKGNFFGLLDPILPSRGQDRHLHFAQILLGPKFLREAKQFRGVAFAWTGFDKNKQPEWVLVVLPGNAKVPSEVIRSMVNGYGDRKVKTVEGIDITESQVDSPYEDLELPRFGSSYHLPTRNRMVHASAKDIFLIGSSVESLESVIQRWKGKVSGPTLRDSLKEIAEFRKLPGVYFRADAATLATFVDREIGQTETRERATWWEAIRKLVPPAAMKPIQGHFSLHEGFRCVLQLECDANRMKPLLNLFGTEKVTAESLTSLADDPMLQWRMAFPSGADRTAKALAVADMLVKATGTLGATPSEVLKELETEHAALQPRRVLSGISGMTVVMPNSRLRWFETPAIVFHTETSESATAIGTLILPVLNIAELEPSSPVTEKLDGLTIRSLATTGSPFGNSLHYGSHGKRFVLATNPKRVASLLNAKAATTSDSAPLQGEFRIAKLLTPLLPPETKAKLAPRRLLASHESPASPMISQNSNFAIPQLRMFVKDLDSIPPLRFQATRTGNTIRIQFEQAPPENGFSYILNAGWEWYQRRYPRMDFRDYFPSELNFGEGMMRPDFLPPLELPGP